MMELGLLGVVDGPRVSGSETTAGRLLCLGEYGDKLLNGVFVRNDYPLPQIFRENTSWCARLSLEGSIYFLVRHGAGTEVLVHEPASGTRRTAMRKLWSVYFDSFEWSGHVAVDISQGLLCVVETSSTRCEYAYSSIS